MSRMRVDTTPGLTRRIDLVELDADELDRPDVRPKCVAQRGRTEPTDGVLDERELGGRAVVLRRQLVKRVGDGSQFVVIRERCHFGGLLVFRRVGSRLRWPGAALVPPAARHAYCFAPMPPSTR
jgi:hypothetical protein